METNGFQVVEATQAHKPDILRLLIEYLPGTDAVARYDWLYERNPHGKALTIIAYEPGGAPVAVTSVFPRRVLVDREVRLGSMGGDGYVSPAFRRKGVATALHNVCFSSMKERGIGFMFGPPEPHNLKALVRAGSRVVTQVRRYVRPYPVQAAVRLFTGPSRRARLEPIEGEDRRVAAIWEELVALGGVMPVRDPAHYAWRFLGCPSGQQRAYAVVEGNRTIALAAVERRGRQIALVDLVAPPERYHAAVNAVAGACPSGVVSFQLNEHGLGAAELWRSGFVPREAKPFQVLALGDHPSSSVLNDGPSWYYTWGDGDVDQVL